MKSLRHRLVEDVCKRFAQLFADFGLNTFVDRRAIRACRISWFVRGLSFESHRV